MPGLIVARQDVNEDCPFPGILRSLSFGNRYAGFKLAYMPEAGARSITSAQIDDPALRGVFYLQLKTSLDCLLT